MEYVCVCVCVHIYLLHSIQTMLGAHPTTYPVGTGGSFLRSEADHSRPTSAEVRKTWIYTSTSIHLHGIVFNHIYIYINNYYIYLHS
jgi:hypothetical protein